MHFGWLVRSIHSWSANLMIATLFVHMFSVYLMKAYRPPRELTGNRGAVVVHRPRIRLGGYLLPWNKLALRDKGWTEIAGVVPVIGTSQRFLRAAMM